MAEERGGKQAKIKLGIDYDPEKIEKFINQLVDTRENLIKTDQGFSKFKSGLKGLKGLLTSAATALAGFLGGKEIHEAENIRREFAFVFKGIERQATETARIIQKKFGLSFEESQRKLIDLKGQLKTLGLSNIKSLEISETIIERAAETANATGKNFEEVLQTFRQFITSGGSSAQGFAKLFGKDTKLYELLFEHSRQTTITGKPQAAQALRAISALRGATDQFVGSVEKDPSLSTKKRKITGGVADLINKTAQELEKSLHAVYDGFLLITPQLTKFSTALAAAIEVLTILGVAKGSKTILGKAGLGGAGALAGKAGLAGAAVLIAYKISEVLEKSLEKKFPGFNEKFDSSAEKVLEKTGLKSINKKIIDFLLPTKKEKGKAGANVQSNLTININARTDDPKKLASLIRPEIETHAENVFKMFNEREIAGQTSAHRA